MSDRLAAKIKENAGKPKYSSLNLNQTYKGNKVEIKTSTGATRHGLQSLGKIGSSRRIPPPANLPSLKSENSGNDPTVSLVPSGGGGWGSAKDKTESSTPQNLSPSTTPAPQTSQGSVPTTQQPLLQPQRPIQPSSYPSSQPATQQQSQSSGPTRQDTTTTTQEKSEAHAKTWGTISQSEAGGQAKPYSHQPTPYFNREFPTLGGQDNGETRPERKEFSHGQAPIIRNTHEPPWMERSGPGPPSHGYGRDHDMFNGGPGRGEYHRRPPPDYQHNRGGPQSYQPHHYNNSHHPSQGGRPPPHGYPPQDPYSRPYQRPGPGQRPGMRIDKRYEADKDMENKPVIRPAVLRPEDIQAMDDEDDDGGWAGAHGEVDYTAKLNFEDFDDEEKEKSKGNKEDDKNKVAEEKRVQKSEEQSAADIKKESDQGKESTQYKRPQDPDRLPQQPKSAWGEPAQGPPQYGDGQYGRDSRSAPPQRPFDSHRPPQGQSYHGGSAPWNMQYPPPQRAPQGQYSPVSGSPPAGRGPPGGTPPKQDSMGPPMRREDEPLSEWATRKQEMHAAVERARMRTKQEEQERQAKTKAAAMMKLKALEEKHGKGSSEIPDEIKEGVQKPRTDSLESGKSDRDTRGEEIREKNDKDTELPSDQKTGHYPAQLHSDQKVPQFRPEDSSRRRNDSDSSDASRSSGSRQYIHHPQRNIPPRFQQQRQQQQQQYQQQQLYQATHPMSHPQREIFDVPPPQVADSGPVSPSGAGKPNRPAEAPAPKRIMKRTDSSSTAGDDVASVKSLDSTGEREKGSRQRANSGTASSLSEQETHKTDARDKTRPGDSTAKSVDKETRKEVQEEKKSEKQREKSTSESTVKDRSDQELSAAVRKREYRSSDRKPEEVHKRKREENEDDYEERRNKMTNRDRQTDGRGRLRPGSGYRGRGRGSTRGRSEYRAGGRDGPQRGLRETRQGRDSRDSRDYRKDEKAERTREPLKSEDRNKDVSDKISSEEREAKGKTERAAQRKDEKAQPDRESQERKTSYQEKPAKDAHEKEKGERRSEKPDKRMDRYERKDERERIQRKPSDQRRTDSNKENKAEPKRAIFPARDVREEDQKMTMQRPNRDGQDRRQERDRYRDHDNDYYRERPRERDRDKDRERTKPRDQDRIREVPRSSRGHERGHRGPAYVRGRGAVSARGGRRGSGRLVGSGRISQRPPKKEELSSDEEDVDDSGSESSSYATATSASEEGIEEKEEKPKEQPRSSSQSASTSRPPIRSARGSRARGGGGFQRPRREQEKPPRFQKQQERAAAQRGSSSRGGFRSADRGSRGRGRGRGRGRVMPSTRDIEDRDGGSIQPTEDWEDEVNQNPKEQDKSVSSQKRASKSSDQYSSRRTSSRDDSGRQGGRRDGGPNSTRKADSFLAEKQVKVEGSKLTTSESKGALPAAKSTDLTQGKKSSGTPKEEKRSDYSAVDTIDGKTQKHTDSAVKKANIQLYDLHNVAGVICIDDIPDDASDISSSGFVEVTSKRTQKELKEKQREEDERRKRNEEKASQRNSEKSEKFKKNQANKPPRFSKQHQNASTSGSQGKAVVTKTSSGVALDGITGLVSSGINSNSSSTNSTKRNSPVTVERPLSPQQPPPVFNAWNKPLSLVTPAKAPGSSLAIASNVPDPLAVGSGKPSRHPQPSTVMPVQNSLINSNIEDKSAEDELKEITKEIESMAPTEEQEEVQEKTEKKPEHSTASSGTRERRHDGEKKSQPKPQRPPRFDKSSKRKSTTEDGAKKEYAKEESKKEKSRLPAKQSDAECSDVSSITKRTSGEEKSLVPDATPSDKEVTKVITEDTPSEEKEVKRTENDEADRESEKESVPRKDSDYSVDSEEQASEDSSVFSSRPLSVDINDSSGETRDRPPTPVSPIYADLTKRMDAAFMAWHQITSTSVGLATVSMETPSSWPETSSPSVSIGSKDGSTIVESSADKTSEYRENTEDNVSKSDVTKPTEVQYSGKKPGGNEQQNVCKVKPQQQQQPVKPQQTSTLAPSSGDDRGQSDLESMVSTQPVLTQDHLLRQNVHNTYPFQIDAQLLQLQQRQTQQFIHQPLQSLPQTAQVAANSYQLSAQMQQVRQPTSASSLSQSQQELFQSPFMTSNLYNAGGFPVSQPYVSLNMVATTTTPSYVSTSTRTQATSVMALQGQQPKSMNSSMFGPSGSPAQTVYMPFDPQSMGGTATLLNFNQQSQQAAQRQMMGNQAVGFSDVIPQQAQVQHAPPPPAAATPQQIQSQFSYHAKPAGFDSQQGTSLKSMEPSHAEYNQSQSEMVKHINAKPFEPPKRLSTPTPSSSTSNSGMGLLTSAVNPNLVHIGPSPPNMGALSHSPPMQTSYISNRPVSMSPVDPNVSFAAGANSFAKHPPMGHYQLSQQQRQQTPVQQFTPFQQQPVHIKPQQLQQHQTMNIRPQGQPNQLPSQQQHNAPHMPSSGVPHQIIPRQYGHVGPSQPSVSNQRFPGPIQRPPTSGALQGMPPNISQHQQRPIQPPRPIRQVAPRMPHAQKVPILSSRPQFQPPATASSQSNQFKAMQHQKMLEETRMFFATDTQSRQKSQSSSVNETGSANELKGQNLQQQGQKQGQVFPQTYAKQQMPMHPMVSKHQNAPMQEGIKMTSQQRQSLQHKQVPLAPTSGVHHQNKPPRMSQENKPKQTNQDKKDKKEENKSHIIELPRKKPQDNINKPKPNKTDSSKSEDAKQANRMDGKPNTNKRSGPVRIPPMIQKPPPGGGRQTRPTKPRPQVKNTNVGVPQNKPKTDGTATTTATGAPSTATTSTITPKPPNDAVVSSKGKDLEESSPKGSEEVKATVNPLTTMTS